MKAEFHTISPTDQRLQPIIKGLFDEYRAMYGNYFDNQNEVEDPNVYCPAKGIFLILQQGQEIIATGAYKQKDVNTAEIKRIWTHPKLRQQGIAKLMLNQLEKCAYQAGYRSVYLTTGFKQVSAVKLYLAQDYTPLFDVHASLESYSVAPFDGKLPFTKKLAITQRYLSA